MSEPPWVSETQLTLFENEVQEVEGLLDQPLLCSQDYVEAIEKESNVDNEALNDKFNMDCLFDVPLDSEVQKIEEEGLSEDSLRLISAPENEKSRKIYARYQKFFKDYVFADDKRNYGENTLVNFFVWMNTDNVYSPGSFWCIYSCVRAMILCESRIDIKNYILLRKTIKQLTVHHLKKKADVIPASDFKRALEEMYDENDPKDLRDKVGVTLLYYGYYAARS